MKNLDTGVYKTLKKNGKLYYRASITYKGKHISLGSFSSANQAHQAYLDANLLIHTKQIHIDDFEEYKVTLSFEKWVVLLNFRDNAFYIKTPIYLKRGYFLYYYSPELCLKFDVDDLFFYSHHKIMKRGNHLFVSEYGMQTGILSRYGIKNFAVEGRDYQFVNGDTTDFRYANIKIINRYFGVRKEFRKGMPVYTAKIHLKGDLLIGRYSTEIEAAIAYNKASAILKAKGITKNYPENYVDEVDEIDYAKIYHMVRISKKIREYQI